MWPSKENRRRAWERLEDSFSKEGRAARQAGRTQRHEHNSVRHRGRSPADPAQNHLILIRVYIIVDRTTALHIMIHVISSHPHTLTGHGLPAFPVRRGIVDCVPAHPRLHPRRDREREEMYIALARYAALWRTSQHLGMYNRHPLGCLLVMRFPPAPLASVLTIRGSCASAIA